MLVLSRHLIYLQYDLGLILPKIRNHQKIPIFYLSEVLASPKSKLFRLARRLFRAGRLIHLLFHQSPSILLEVEMKRVRVIAIQSHAEPTAVYRNCLQGRRLPAFCLKTWLTLKGKKESQRLFITIKCSWLYPLERKKNKVVNALLNWQC